MQQDGEHGEEIQGSNGIKKMTANVNKNKHKNRFNQALSLPTLCNLNPRSIYNKREEFRTLVKEEDLDIIFLSESWER